MHDQEASLIKRDCPSDNYSMCRTGKTFHKTKQTHTTTCREEHAHRIPFSTVIRSPKGSSQCDFCQYRVPCTEPATHGLPTLSWHGERAARTAREAQTLPMCQRETRVKEFKGFWILPTPLVTTFRSCNDPSDSAEALFLLQKSVVIC